MNYIPILRLAVLASIQLLSVISLLGQITPAGKWSYPQARVVIKVIDETGGSMSQVQTVVGFCGATNQAELIPAEGTSDINGLFVAQGYSDGMLGARLKVDGYYLGSGNIPVFRNQQDGRWQPWGATTQRS